LVSGEDGTQVAETRTQLVRTIIGPDGEAEMRLERLLAADVRRDAALLQDTLKAAGFFPGPRVVLLEDASDGLAPIIASALDASTPEDARLVVTGAGLSAKGALRKLLEGRRDAVTIILYDDPPTEAELEERLREAGVTRVDPTAQEELWAIAQSIAPGELRGLLDRLGLYQIGTETPLSLDAVRALAPQAGEAEVDDLLAAVLEKKRERIPPLLTKLEAEGIGPVAVAIQAIRHMRALVAVTSDPGGVQAGISALRPPAFGPRRDALARAAVAWKRERIEGALRGLVELDLTLRSGGGIPDRALLERVLLRLAG
jgi:DNA polymerase-3 subunit delta